MIKKEERLSKAAEKIGSAIGTAEGRVRRAFTAAKKSRKSVAKQARALIRELERASKNIRAALRST
jgi:predicted nucleotide-binding protein (sugar kinase/HSP70/actin superfamily)